MAKPRRGSGPKQRRAGRRTWAAPTIITGSAPPHGALANNLVHVFVDDQNLFYGIVNEERDRSYRMDFGELLTEVSKGGDKKSRGIRSAYIAGVIPDDDTFWQIAENQGFTVRRGFLGANNRSKQDDAYLIADMVSTLFEHEGPSTIILVAGDADYVPPLKKSLEKGWRNEVAFIRRGVSAALHPFVHEYRTISAAAIELMRH
jgi:uncharacterized LabA/DUF88 family protein